MFAIYLGGSIIPRSLMFSASSPALPHEPQGSFDSRKHVKSCFQSSAFATWHETMQYLLIWRWCWMTMFFSWMVSRRAVARDLRSEMDWGVSGKLQPFSSESSSSFTAHTSQVSTSNYVSCRRHDRAFKTRGPSVGSWVWSWPCLVDRTPVSALLLGFPPTLEFLLHSSALCQQEGVCFLFRTNSNKTFINPLAHCSHCSGEMFQSFCWLLKCILATSASHRLSKSSWKSS